MVTDQNYFRHEKISNSQDKDSFTGIKIGSGPKQMSGIVLILTADAQSEW